MSNKMLGLIWIQTVCNDYQQTATAGLHFAYRVILQAFCRLLIFSKSTFSKNSFRNTIRVSNSLDPDQARHFVGPDLNRNCSQRLSADGSSRPTLCLLGNFACLLSSADFFKNQLFRKILSGIQSECQTVWIQIRPNILSGLIWIQTVCQGYQLTALADLLFAYWVILHAFLSSADFFQNQLFRKVLSGVPSECQTVRIQIRPDILSALICIQTVCKCYQQTILAGKEINNE